MKKSMAIISIAVICLFIIAAGSAQAYTTGDTKTKYPIVLVPGVMGFDALFGTVEYFYKVADGINKVAFGTDIWGNAKGKIAYNVNVSSWKKTEDRGNDLKIEIQKILMKHYNLTSVSQITSSHKVNILAHSHGATTSRVAVSLIPSNIASLTTVAGPHYGTPMADYAITIPKPVITMPKPF